MISRILLAALMAFVSGAANAGEDSLARVRSKAKALIEEARANPNDADLQFRVRIAKAILAQGSNIRYEYGAKGERRGDCRYSDCSGYVSSTAGLFCKLSGSAGDMYRVARTNQALGGEPKFLDVVFFRAPGAASIGHVGYYIDDEVFLNMGGKQGSLLRVTRYEGNDAVDNDDTTWASDRAGYADLTKIPRYTDQEIAAKVARSNHEKVIRTGPGVVGGVYISPALVLEASEMDDSGFLDAIESTISDMNFDENPVQELPDLQPPDGFGGNERDDAPRARLEGADAYRELLRAAPR